MLEDINEKEEEIRRYLLGEMAEAEMKQFEERLMIDDQLFETLCIVEEDLLDARAIGDLTAEEQKRAEGYFLAAPQRRERLDFARALQTYATSRTAVSGAEQPIDGENSKEAGTLSVFPVRPVPPGQEVQSPFWSSWRGYAALAAAAVMLIALTIGIWPRRFVMSDAMQALNEAFRTERPTQAAITRFDYAPPPPRTRGGEKDKSDYVALDRAEALIRQEVASRSDAASRQDSGRLHLAKRQYDQAIDEFKKALALNPNSALIESDLGAAYMEKGKASSSGEARGYLDQSLSHLTRAIELDGLLLSARFNLALLYEQLGRGEDAQDAWRRYLEKDQNSKWATEATAHLESPGS